MFYGVFILSAFSKNPAQPLTHPGIIARAAWRCQVISGCTPAKVRGHPLQPKTGIKTGTKFKTGTIYVKKRIKTLYAFFSINCADYTPLHLVVSSYFCTIGADNL